MDEKGGWLILLLQVEELSLQAFHFCVLLLEGFAMLVTELFEIVLQAFDGRVFVPDVLSMQLRDRFRFAFGGDACRRTSSERCPRLAFAGDRIQILFARGVPDARSSVPRREKRMLLRLRQIACDSASLGVPDAGFQFPSFCVRCLSDASEAVSRVLDAGVLFPSLCVRGL